jgi:hypothetical protein
MRMAERQPEPHRGDRDALHLERAAVVQVRGDEEGHVDLAPDQEVFEIVARILDGRDPDRRIGPPEPRQRVRQPVARDERGDAEPDLAAPRLGPRREGAAGVRHVVADLARVAQELVARVRDLDPVRLPLEERDAKVGLERLDRLGHRGLRDRQRLGRAGHALVLGRGDEELKLSKREGQGPVVAMPVTGYLSARTGARPMILLGGVGLVLCLPILAALSAPLPLAVALLFFGASLGTIDVAMNVHAAEIEKARARPLMSGFHAMWSVGGVLGAGGMTLLLSLGLSPLAGACAGSALALAALLYARPRFLVAQGGEAPAFVRPRGIVLLLAVLAGITFLVEGAVLDWSALLVVGRGLVEPALGGLGYMLFSVAMVVGRLTGDRIVGLLGPRRVLAGAGSSRSRASRRCS